jgi:hypothetical protein
MSTVGPWHGAERGSRPEHESSSTAVNNSLNAVPDGEESDSEWWEEEDDVGSNQPKSRSAQATREPRTVDNNTGAGNPTKPPTRANTRKLDKRYSVQKPKRDKSKGRQRKQNALAGIKVITNFSKGLSSTQVAHVQPSRPIPQAGCFVDLAALQALDGDAGQASQRFWKSKKHREPAKVVNVPPTYENLQPQVSKNLDAHPPARLKPKSRVPSPLDLSPSDRPIVIGISIPSAAIAEHTLSPETAVSTTSNILHSYQQRTPTSFSPETPTIIITPAHAGSIWSALDDSNTGSFSPPESSIYSPQPHNAMRIYNQNDAPPVPRMPVAILESEKQRIAAQKSYFSPDSDASTPWDNDEDTAHNFKSRSRAFSTGTVFEEDESPIIVRRGRAVSISTGSKDMKHASISTVATRRRSKGWWNYITTPFLTRSNTVATRGVFDNQQPPALPSLATAAAKAQEAERDGKLWEKQFSPLTPQTTSTISSESWWDASAKEQQSKHMAVNQSPTIYESRHRVQTYSGTLPFVLGETAALGGNTPSNLATPNLESEANRNMQRSVQPLETPTTISDGPISRAIPANNPYVQPRLADLSNRPRELLLMKQRAAQLPRPIVTQGLVLPSPPPPYTTVVAHIPLYRAVLPPSHVQNRQYPISPGPLSPGLQQAMSSGGGIPMSAVPLTPAARRPADLNSGYSERSESQVPMVFDPPPLQALSSKAQKAEAKRRRNEKEDAIAYRAGGWWRGRGCISNRGCYGRSGPEGRKKRRWYIGLIVGFLSIIILAVVLATTLHRKSNTAVGPSQWLNLAGLPPIFTGLSTVAAPANLKTDTGCVFPATQWSCDLPKELQESVAPNPSNQPNFLLQIQWDNSSATNDTFSNVTGNPKLETRNLVGNPVSAGQFIKRILLRTSQIVSFAPNPAPPSYAEEFFLGNTTDGIVSNTKAGEPTPFYISFLSTTDLPNTKRQLIARQTDQFPNVSEIIPSPSSQKDGTASPANLLPLPSQQPIRLYDRGLPSEHYGFYSYFDRSIFLKSITPLNGSNANNGQVPDDENGGSTQKEANFRCTWAETRFLVQMWTRMNGTSRLLNSTAGIPSSSGLNFTQPGTFPYPITITVDRHGGEPKLKMMYCYEMNDRNELVSTSGRLIGENRAFGGTIINPAPKIFSNESDPSIGGVDGGTGGCSCQWSNFQNVA